MSPIEMNHKWSKKLIEKTICREVSAALRNAHESTISARKNIARITNRSEATIKKWYQGKNPPDTAHLLMLMAYYPAILRAVLEIIGREDLWDMAVRTGIPRHMQNSMLASNHKNKIWGDTNVTPPEENIAPNSVQFNDRQLWFLDKLTRQQRMQNKDIANFWKVAERTAKRDTQELANAGLIRTVRVGSNSWYERSVMAVNQHTV